MRYYVLDEVVDPVSKESLRVEPGSVTRREGPVPRKCRVWCGYRAVHASEVSGNECGECADIWIETGTLIGSTGRYEIAGGIPRLIVSRQQGAPSAPGLSADVQETFGYEWEAFDHLLPEYDGEARNYFQLLAPSAFEGQVVVDAGCGMGRWAMYAARMAPDRLYAIDFSRAIDRAAARLEATPRAHCIQADLAFLPLRDGSADVTYCLGVLHHLVTPDDGMRELVRGLRSDGSLLVYLYYALDNRPAFYRALLSAVTAVRRVTAKLPKRVMHALAAVIGLLVYWPLARLAALTSAILGGHAASYVPLHHYARHSLAFMIADAFDRFGTPVEFRYSRQEIREWLARYGLQSTFAETSPFWVVLGRPSPEADA